MTSLENTLKEEIKQIYNREVNEKTKNFTQMFTDSFEDSLVGIVAYGSKFCGKPSPTSIFDFFFIVDDLNKFYDNSIFKEYNKKKLVQLNKHLPPNIFTYCVEKDGEKYEAKYNVVTLESLKKYTGPSNRDIYFSGRFAKVMGLCYTKNKDVEKEIVDCTYNAYTKHNKRILTTLPKEFTLDEFALAHIRLGYSADVRVESETKVHDLYLAGKKDYDNISRLILDNLIKTKVLAKKEDKYINPQNPLSMLKINSFFIERKFHSIIRTLKNTQTTKNWEGYVVDKIERSTGQSINTKYWLPSAIWALVKHSYNRTFRKS